MIPKTILIADDDTDLVAALELRCRQLGLEVVTAEDALTALSSVDCIVPDLVCMDVSMPGGNGLAACEMMADDERLSSIPVIILTGSSDEETIRRCHRMNAYYVQKSSDVWQRVEPILCELLEIELPEPSTLPMPDQSVESWSQSPTQRHGLKHVLEIVGHKEDNAPAAEAPVEENSDPSRRPRVLYVEDDVEESNAMKMRLESLGVEVIQAFDGMEGYRTAFTEAPDVILCDFMMPQGEGDYALRRFKENPATENVPVIFLTGKPGNELKRRMYGLGAAGFLTKPVDLEILVRELSRFIPINQPTPLATITL